MAATAANALGVSEGTLSAVANIGNTWWQGGNVRKAIKNAGGLEMAKRLKKRVEEHAKTVPIVGSVLSAAVSNVRVLSEAVDELKESFKNNESQLNALILMVEKYVKENNLGLTKEAIMEFDQNTVNVVHRMIAEFNIDGEEGAEIVPVDDADELAEELEGGAEAVEEAAKPAAKPKVKKAKAKKLKAIAAAA